jgi:hypothetical protein
VLNNSLVPLIFAAIYLYEIITFQISNQYSTPYDLMINLSGLFLGFGIMMLLFFAYFRFTNKDIFKYVICRIDEKIKQNVQVTRASAMKKLDIARKKQVRVDYYLDEQLRLRPVEDNSFYDRATVLQVFDQNHFNLVVIELFIFAFVLVLGIFKDYAVFQIPAAASFTILLTIFVMMAGAFSYWFGGWAATSALIIFLALNYLVGENFFTKRYEAFGLDYHNAITDYSITNLQNQNSKANIEEDRQATLVMLENWRKKFTGPAKPKMVFICVSGGGKRAALWALSALQTGDSITHGKLMKNSILITGASGGLIGASYFRELKLRATFDENVNPYANVHRQKISTDNLNPLIFGLLANDLFVGFSKFEYGGHQYIKDRSYTFEEQLNQITDGLMNKPISAYNDPETKALIPMMILTPTIVNDGRRLYIASHPVSFMNIDAQSLANYGSAKISGADFMRMFHDQGAANLRFLSALRMSATFPYITPNTTLPSNPPIQIMDAGISDNFGLTDAVRFFYAFREWIDENTSGIVVLSIRDSPKLSTITSEKGSTIVDDVTQPISSVYNNFENFQDITSDLLLGQARSWFKGSIYRVDIQYQHDDYVPILQKMDSIRQNNARASLSWRLTTREKQNIIDNLNSTKNKLALEKIKTLLD